ncbi:MAG: hypothetical protein H0T60_10260 [Acidobacteria bacterium]|nr:hypothetical protein [Acidobacteriota bacterium]
MLGCYRKDDVSDPAAFLGGVTAILAKYPVEVINIVTDPALGIPARIKFLPALAEVREACEREYEPMRRELEREKRFTETQELLTSPEDRSRRLTYAELKAKHGDDWGIRPPPEPVREAALSHYQSNRPLTASERQSMYAARKGEG